ncbi:hypothetical protein MRY87_07325 [bacterium]|nr:hypothetical protein [bacterium]
MATYYPEIIYWKKTYAHPGVLDKRAVESFIDCETAERVNSLRGQIHSVAKGKFDEHQFIKQMGPDRKQRHGSYEEWAKLMLQWMAGYKG